MVALTKHATPLARVTLSDLLLTVVEDVEFAAPFSNDEHFGRADQVPLNGQVPVVVHRTARGAHD